MQPSASHDGIADVLRRHWLKILAVTVIAVGTAVALTLVATPKYSATATISFRDLTQDLGLVGTPSGTLVLPQQLAAAGAQGLTRPENIEEIRQRMGATFTQDDVRDSISTAVDTASTLVSVTAERDDEKDAARLANITAEVAVKDVNDTARTRYRAAARAIEAEIAKLPDPKPNAPLDPTRTAYADELSRLSSLAIVAQPAEISGAAVEPDSPSSPKPLLNIAIGLLFGGALGVGIALLAERADKRLRDPDDIVELLDLPMLGRVRESSMGGIVPLSAPKDEADAIAIAAFGILRRNVELLADASGRTGVVAVTSGSPEEGKTTVAVSLAGAFAVAGRRVLLVDCDLRRPTVASRLALEPTPGLAEFFQDDAQPQDVLRVVALPSAAAAAGSAPDQVSQSVVVVPAGSPPPRPEALLGSDRFATFIAQVREAYDVVILDTSPVLPVADTLELLPMADVRLICARVDRTTRSSLTATGNILRRLPDKPTGIVVTGLSSRHEEQLGYGDTSYAYSYLDTPA